MLGSADLALAKYAAGRDKALVFPRELATRGLVTHDVDRIAPDEKTSCPRVATTRIKRVGLWQQKLRWTRLSFITESLEQIRGGARQD